MFFYPKKTGLIQWVDQITEQLKKQNVSILTSTQVKQIQFEHQMPRSVVLSSDET